jgi:hypothetical protein
VAALSFVFQKSDSRYLSQVNIGVGGDGTENWVPAWAVVVFDVNHWEPYDLYDNKEQYLI